MWLIYVALFYHNYFSYSPSIMFLIIDIIYSNCLIHILFKLFLEKLTREKLDVPEVTQSEEGQKQKLYVVLGSVNNVSEYN